ncbi:uncharacterized protein LOC131538605 isoform X2 [Onychostoma macrolepis]|uniref:uncharacterized protein LOC131538605 isoform X2 n=1 Tax=Onychostoma macrolepis TaxID=369639 RepID=UPI00272C1463|nr:uncharacterized protein LOC131538605 isoform X2 [Onychostoma macrolepis]
MMCRHKSHRGKKTSRSVRVGSLFERSKLSLSSWLIFIYRFAQGLRIRQIDMMQDGIAKSSRTLSKMARIMRKVCHCAIKRFRRRHGQMIGSAQEFAVLDESNLRHKRKYGRGRASTTWRRKKWVFGMLGVRDKCRHPILRLVKRRSRPHLIPIVVKHVRPGTTIISDEWRAYRGVLANMGYKHFTVNHSQWFVDPHSGAHSQHIERAWLTYKTSVWRLRGNRTEKMLKEHLSLIEWTHWLGEKNKRGPLGHLIKDIRHQFPG